MLGQIGLYSVLCDKNAEQLWFKQGKIWNKSQGLF